MENLDERINSIEPENLMQYIDELKKGADKIDMKRLNTITKNRKLQ